LVRESDSFHIVKNSKAVQPHKSLSIGLPNGNTIRSKAVGHIDKFHNSPMLQDTTTSAVVEIPAHIFSDDQLNHTLFSVADYCNQGCTSVFTKTGFEIVSYDETVILNGHKHPQAKLRPVILLQIQQIWLVKKYQLRITVLHRLCDTKLMLNTIDH
jgi:hypothetical protein